MPEPCSPQSISTVGPGLLEPDRGIDRPHQLDKLVVDDLDDLLLGPHSLDELRSRRPVGDPLHELLDDLQIDVGFQQRGANLAQSLLHVRFGQNAADLEAPKGGRKPFLKVIEHRKITPGSPGIANQRV